MKTSIQFIALAFLVVSSTGVLASGTHPEKARPANTDSISFQSLINNTGIRISIRKHAKSNSVVTIYDEQGNFILQDRLPDYLLVEKNYILGDEGMYVFRVSSPGKIVRKKVRVGYATEKTISVQD